MNDFQKVLEDLIALFGELTGLESVKLDAVSKNRVATVEECMTKEQALILRLKGLDKERENAQKEAGYEGLTFKEILLQATEDEKRILLPLFDGLSRQIQVFQEISENAKTVLEVNLHQIRKALAGQGDNVYTDKGVPESKERHMTNRRV